MKKKWPLLLSIAILLAGIIGSVLVLQIPNTNRVRIVRDGKILCELDLMREKDRTISFEYEGRINTIEIKNHQIHMLKADCPDNTCVHMGWLNSAIPIVCLPNHLVIEFVDGAGDADVIAQ